MSTQVQRGLEVLGWDAPVGQVEGLSGGASGSSVFWLGTAGERLVLKVTENPRRRDRALRELRVYQELGPVLGDVLPVLHAGRHAQHGVFLLLSASEPFPPARSWTPDAWLRVADRLGRWQRTPVHDPTWVPLRPDPSTTEVAVALRHWTARGTGALAARAARRLAEGAERRRARTVGPVLVLTHGDCHVGNLLQGRAGQPLWVDWQDVCLTTGLDDLVFLWQRAEFDGAHPPRAALTAAYAAARGLPDDASLRQELSAADLRLLLVAWPQFLRYGTREGQQLMTHRLQQLVEEGER